MLKTGTVPVLPSGLHGPREFLLPFVHNDRVRMGFQACGGGGGVGVCKPILVT